MVVSNIHYRISVYPYKSTSSHIHYLIYEGFYSPVRITCKALPRYRTCKHLPGVQLHKRSIFLPTYQGLIYEDFYSSVSITCMCKGFGSVGRVNTCLAFNFIKVVYFCTHILLPHSTYPKIPHRQVPAFQFPCFFSQHPPQH